MKNWQDKRVSTAGKLCLCMAAMVSTPWIYTQGSIRLSAKSVIDESPLTQLGKGEPFYLDVTADAIDAHKKPVINGIEKFRTEAGHYVVFNNNGDVSVKQRSKIYIDQPGSYTLGPATSSDATGATVQSNTVTITVSAEPTAAVQRQAASAPAAHQNRQQQQTRQTTPKALLRLTTDKKEIFIGETVTLALKFYGQHGLVQLGDTVQPPDLKAFNASAPHGPDASFAVMDNTEYEVLAWEWELQPRKTGTLTIPPTVAEYLEQENVFPGFGAFGFPFMSRRYQVKSNQCDLVVKPLPPYNGPGAPVTLIGNFIESHASVNVTAAQQHEGIVLTICLEGVGNTATCRAPVLQEIPAALRWYDSKHYQQKTAGAHGKPVTCFEYILQGIEPGNYTIPEQKIPFFNPAKQQYAMLTTKPIQLSIRANGGSTAAGKQVQENDTQQSHVIPNSTDLLPLAAGMHNLATQSSRRPMDPLLLCLLGLIPVLLVLTPSILRLVRTRMPYVYYYSAFNRARTAIKKHAQGKSSKTLPEIFVDLLATRWRVPSSHITQEYIEQQFVKLGMQADTIRAWQDFYSAMLEQAFYTHTKAGHASTDLYEQASTWIDRLEKYL